MYRKQERTLWQGQGERRASLCLSLLVALLAAVLAQDPAQGRQVSPGRATASGVYLRYLWQERVDTLVISHELHLYGNGFIRYAQQPGIGTPHETTLPSDEGFVSEAERLFREARDTRVGRPPCGAPQGGQLIVELGRRVERFDLSLKEHWSRYGHLARLLVARAVGAPPASLEADCQPLRLRVDPSRVATLPRKPKAHPSREAENGLLLAYGEASTEEERRKKLARLAGIRDGDRFFRWSLLRRYPRSLEARRLVRQHGSVLVRGVRSEAEAQELLPHLERLGTTEGLYHRSVLEQVLWRIDEAATGQRAYRRALNQLAAAEREGKDLAAFHGAAVDVRRHEAPWGPIRKAYPRLFLAWLDLAERVFMGDPAEAPPLAILLYRRALHYAAMSVLAPSVRADRGGPQAVRRARALVSSYFEVLSKGSWDGLGIWAQQDLLSVEGALRRSDAGFDKEWVAQTIGSPAVTVCRMIGLHEFDVAERFLGRMVEKRGTKEGPLRLAQGRCLRAAERFSEAREALSQAIQHDVPLAREARVGVLLDEGDLEGAEREVEAVAPKTPAVWLALSRLYRLQGRAQDAVEAARRAGRAMVGGADGETLLALGRSLQQAGQVEGARVAYQKASLGTSRSAWVARERWARLELAVDRPAAAREVALPLVEVPQTVAQVSGHVLLGLAAARLSLPELAALQVERARYHADTDPIALGRLAELLAEGGYGHAVALEALDLAIGLRPGSSVLYAHQALLLGQLRRIPEALEAIATAVTIRGAYPPYRALEAALVKLSVVGRPMEKDVGSGQRGEGASSAPRLAL